MKKILGISFVLLFYYGCATTSEIGTERTVESSSSTPGWTLTPTKQDNDFYFFTGQMTKAKDMSFGLKQAYADGLQNLMNTMQNNIGTESAQALRGANMDEDDIGRFSGFAVAWISETKTVAGVLNPEAYWEKIETKTPSGVSYNYNCYSLLKISKKDYDKSLEGAYENMKKKAREENNKKAEVSADKLLDSVRKTTK